MSLSKVEQLEVAAIIAPTVRSAPKAKRIGTLDKDGRPTGRRISQVELIEKQFLREGIEITRDPKKGERPAALYCRDCGIPFKVPKNGRVPVRCAACNRDHYRCTKILDNGDRCNCRINVPPGRCGEHRQSPEERSDRARKLAAAMTPEQRSEFSRKGHAALTPEQRSEISRKRMSAMTPEQRSEFVRNGAAAMTPERRSEICRKRMAALTPEQRSELGRKGAAALTPEQRSELGRKGAAALTPEQRSEISRKGGRKGGRKGAAVRWANHRAKAKK